VILMRARDGRKERRRAQDGKPPVKQECRHVRR
jgi:hypothetical protein